MPALQRLWSRFRSASFLPIACRGLLTTAVLTAAGPLPADEPPLEEVMKRIPATSPEDSLKRFKIEHGFRLELVANEPDVVDPIDACFDEYGRMFVVEMNDYPFLPEQRVDKYVAQRKETWGRIRRLTDTDGDGKMDKSEIYADKVRWPQSVCCYKGGIFVLGPAGLVYFKDTDDDGKADHQETLATGFSTSNVQGLANGLRWGLDHGIWFASGRAGGEVQLADGTKVSPGRRDLRLNPATKSFQLVSGGEQFGHTVDDWGDRFVCNNSNHIEHVVFPLHYLERNPQLAFSAVLRSIAKEGAAGPVFRTSGPEPWRVVRTARRAADPAFRSRVSATELVATGFFTSATGITVYRGGAYPPEFQGNVFIGDVGGNLVHRKKLTPAGASFVAERTEEGVEFLTSTDNWFRPVNFVNAPDGTLYILDMYRETIEHPFSIPDDIKAYVDLESGHDRGRIYRLLPPDTKPATPPKLAGLKPAELVAYLDSPHGWVRDTAHRLIWEAQDAGAVEPLHKLVREAKTPQGQVHALWSLEGLKALAPADLLVALGASDPHVRECGLQLSEPFAAGQPEIVSRWIALTDDPVERVRWQVALSLGAIDGPAAVDGLRRVARHLKTDKDLLPAILSSSSKVAAGLAAELLLDPEASTAFLSELARSVGAESDPAGPKQLLDASLAAGVPAPRRALVLQGLGEGLRRRGARLSSVASETAAKSLADVWKSAIEQAANSKLPEGTRLAAVKLVANADESLLMESFPDLLTPQTPPAIQQAVVAALAAGNSPQAAAALLTEWKTHGPAVRRSIVDALVQSSSGADALLGAVAAGTVKLAEVDRDKQQLLSNHPSEPIRKRARSLLATQTSNRKEIVAKYQPALALTGDATRGQAVYVKNCVTCHRAAGLGHQVGPDLVSVQNKSLEDLLIAVLDPNREAQPNFIGYSATTDEGRVFSGIISAETAASITLRRAEAKEDVVLRETLDALVSSGLSLMPEGVEKEINAQQMADLLAFLKELPAAPAK